MAKIIKNSLYKGDSEEWEKEVKLSKDLCKKIALEKMMSHANAYTHTDDDFYYSILGEEVEENGNHVELSEEEKQIMKKEFEVIYRMLRRRFMEQRKKRVSKLPE